MCSYLLLDDWAWSPVRDLTRGSLLHNLGILNRGALTGSHLSSRRNISPRLAKVPNQSQLPGVHVGEEASVQIVMHKRLIATGDSARERLNRLQRARETAPAVAEELGDKVETASEMSFPASDPPSWIPLARIGNPKHQ